MSTLVLYAFIYLGIPSGDLYPLQAGTPGDLGIDTISNMTKNDIKTPLNRKHLMSDTEKSIYTAHLNSELNEFFKTFWRISIAELRTGKDLLALSKPMKNPNFQHIIINEKITFRLMWQNTELRGLSGWKHGHVQVTAKVSGDLYYGKITGLSFSVLDIKHVERPKVVTTKSAEFFQKEVLTRVLRFLVMRLVAVPVTIYK